jgi:hypothetical protein
LFHPKSLCLARLRGIDISCLFHTACQSVSVWCSDQRQYLVPLWTRLGLLNQVNLGPDCSPYFWLNYIEISTNSRKSPEIFPRLKYGLLAWMRGRKSDHCPNFVVFIFHIHMENYQYE